MALWHLKRIEYPVPSTVSGHVGATCYLVDYEDPTNVAIEHVDVTLASATKKCDILGALDSSYTPNDFDYATECP